MPEIRGLSLTQPWAQLVALGQKQYETRSWKTNYRGLLAIHASKSFPRWARVLCEEDPMFVSVLGTYWVAFDELGRIGAPKPLPLGAIVGTAELVNCGPTDGKEQWLLRKERAFGDWSSGRYAWKLKNPRVLSEPIPRKGSLGLWKLPPEIEERLAAELA